jgi:hypothetical protein
MTFPILKSELSESGIKTVYIVEATNEGWIIERLMRDIEAELTKRGLRVRIGPASGYGGEDVLFNSRYLTPFCDERAKVNSTFITHIDDRIRERELTRSFNKLSSFVCLSPHDAAFISALKGSSVGVVGIELPFRSSSIRPYRLAIFSAFYADNRKNEQWILDYFESRPGSHRRSFTLCLLGSEWEGFTRKLANLDLNFELCRYSRKLDGEYELPMPYSIWDLMAAR